MSKVYSSSENFQPLDIVQTRLQPGMATDGGFRADPLLPRQEFVAAVVPPRPTVVKTSPAAKAPLPAIPEDHVIDLTDNREGDGGSRSNPADPPPPSAQELQLLLDEAYQKGLQEGLAQAEADFGAAARTLLQACQQLDTLRQTILENSSGEMQELALAIAEKVIRTSVREQSVTVERTVAEAIRLAIKSEEIVILVNPADYQTIFTKAEELKAGVSGLTVLTIRGDSTIEIGGCRLESNNCTVDATLSSQLEIIASQLKEQS